MDSIEISLILMGSSLMWLYFYYGRSRGFLFLLPYIILFIGFILFTEDMEDETTIPEYRISAFVIMIIAVIIDYFKHPKCKDCKKRLRMKQIKSNEIGSYNYFAKKNYKIKSKDGKTIVTYEGLGNYTDFTYWVSYKCKSCGAITSREEVETQDNS